MPIRWISVSVRPMAIPANPAGAWSDVAPMITVRKMKVSTISAIRPAAMLYPPGESGIAYCWAEYFWAIHNRLDKNAYNSWYSGVSIYEPMEIPGYTPTAYDERRTPYHNVIAYNNYQDTVNDGTWRGEISSSIGRGNTFKNNIGYAVPGSGVLSNASPFLGGNPVDATNSWENNIAFGAPPKMVAPDAFPVPPNMVDTDPMLKDVGSGNFALKSGSPAVGFGVVVPYWQQQTPGSIDVGACPSGLTACP
jgi:hypothetical protein